MKKYVSLLIAASVLAVGGQAQAQTSRYYARSVVAPPNRTWTGTWSQKGTDGSCQNGAVTTTFAAVCSNSDCDPAAKPEPAASTTKACNVYRTCTATSGRTATGTGAVTGSATCYLQTAIDNCSKVVNAVACKVRKTNTLYGCDTYTPTAFTGGVSFPASSDPLDYGGVCS